MANKKHANDEPSLVELAAKALKPLGELVESEKPRDKLIALNSILVFITISFIISFFLNPDFSDLSSIVIILVSFLFGAIATGAYIYLIVLLKKAYKMKSLRGSIILLFIILPLSVFGLLYETKILIILSLLLIGIQFLYLIITSLFLVDEKIESKAKNIWEFLGKTGTILGIISSLITIGGFIAKFL